MRIVGFAWELFGSWGIPGLAWFAFNYRAQLAIVSGRQDVPVFKLKLELELRTNEVLQCLKQLLMPLEPGTEDRRRETEGIAETGDGVT